MKRTFISLLVFILLYGTSACSPSALTPVETNTLPAVSTNTPLPTPTGTLTPTLTFTPTATQIPFEQMTEEQKLQAAPEIDGLSKGNVSTIKSELVIYRDNEGKAQKVYNLLTKQESTLLEAGIFEIPLTTGENWEVLGFKTGQEAIDYATLVDGAMGTTMDMNNNQNWSIVESLIYAVPDWAPPTGYPVVNEVGSNKVIFGVLIFTHDNGSLVIYQIDSTHLRTIYVDQDAIKFGSEIQNQTILAPHN